MVTPPPPTITRMGEQPDIYPLLLVGGLVEDMDRNPHTPLLPMRTWVELTHQQRRGVGWGGVATAPNNKVHESITMVVQGSRKPPF